MSQANAFFVGWYRRNGCRWRRVVEAETQDDCWTLLPGHAPAGKDRDLCVLPAGTDPNERPKRQPMPMLPGMGGGQ